MTTQPLVIASGDPYGEAVGPFTDVFEGPRARNAFLLQVVMEPPWSIQVSDEAPLTAVALLRGQAAVTTAGSTVRMNAGDVLLARDLEPYVVASTPEALPGVVIGADQTCSGPDGRTLSESWNQGLRTWGNDPHGRDRLVVGTFGSRGEVGRVLLETLPAVALVRDPDPVVVGLMAREIDRDGVGQSAVLDRLLDLVLLAGLRAWFESTRETPVPTTSDRVVRDTLRRIHSEPTAGWTVDDLARHAGVSRSSLNRRFSESTGSSPMAYLTTWRLALAADLLRDPELTLSAISRRVGYSSPFSLSAAFKKEYGVSPTAYRGREG